jgi:hypothetical protein
LLTLFPYTTLFRSPEQRLVAMDREWSTDAWGMDARAREQFEVLLTMPVGGGQALLLRRRPAP